VSIGDKIELVRFSNNDSQNFQQKIYLSQVLDYIDYDKACISMPIENGRIIPLGIGDKYQLCFYCKLGLYQCKAVVIDRYRVENIFMIVVQMISELEKHQRRQYYRLECVIDMSVCNLTQVETEKKKNELEILNSRLCPAMMIDISGGGCKFNSDQLMEKGTQVYMKFALTLAKGMVLFELLGKVVFSIENEKRSKTYEHRVEFINMTEEDREQIVRYIFDEERKRRRKEKGLD
jgi:c-di-GMP-binding flagellar brake protein YcgR